MPREINNFDLMSEEAQEVMNRIPSSLIRWGITVIAIIIGMLLFMAMTVKIPLQETCEFMLTWDSNNASDPCVSIKIPSQAIQSVMNGSKDVILISEALPKECNSKVNAIIDSISNNPIKIIDTHYYIAHAHLFSKDIEILSNNKITIVGEVLIVAGHTTLIKKLF